MAAEPQFECTRCGVCCVAPDIAALDKPLGQRCVHLMADNLCAVYDDRPAVCRGYQPDELCARVAAPTLDQRVALYLAEFGLLEEAAGVARGASASMAAARRLPGLR